MAPSMCRYALHPLSVAQFNGNYFRHRLIFGALNENSGHTMIYIYWAWMTNIFLPKQTDRVGKSIWYKKKWHRTRWRLKLFEVWLEFPRENVKTISSDRNHFMNDHSFHQFEPNDSISHELLMWQMKFQTVELAIVRPKYQRKTKFSL